MQRVGGTVWGTIVPKDRIFDQKINLLVRAKLLIPNNRARGVFNLLNRCRPKSALKRLSVPIEGQDTRMSAAIVMLTAASPVLIDA